jgi:hypothetical protein
MYNAYELDEDQRNFNALVARVQRDKLNSKPHLVKSGGGVVESALDLPGMRERLKDELMTALAPYTDSQGNINITMEDN